MINPDLVNTIRVGELPSEPFNLTDNIPHEIGTDLKRGTVQQLADFISTVIDVSGGVGFRAVSVSDGQTLPETNTQEFILVGKGTYFNVGGGDTIVLTEELNALVSNGSFWFVGVEIPIDVELAGITQEIREGFLTTAPSENAVFNAITNLDIQDVIEVPTFALLPPVGVAQKIYITLDTNILYRFNGTIYVPLSADVSGKEDIANKQNSLAVDGTNLKYPTVTAVNAGLATKQNTISGTTNVVPKFGTGGLVNSTISEDANGVFISGAYALNTVAPLIIRNTAGNAASNISQIWQNPTGTAIATLRNDGFFSTNGTINSGAFATTLAGTATTNAIRLSGQNGTGLFFPTSNILAFSTNAVERLRIHSSGRFSFGSTTDDGTNQLQVNGTVKASPAVTSDQLATLGQVNTSAILLTGDQTATGRKVFTSDNTTLGGISINNNRTSTTGNYGNNAGLFIGGNGSAGILTDVFSDFGARIINSKNQSIGVFSAINAPSGFSFYSQNEGGAAGFYARVDGLSTGLAFAAGNGGANVFQVDRLGAITSSPLAGTGTRNVKATSTGQLTTSEFIDAKSARFELSADINLPISTAGSVSVVDFDSSVFNNDTVLFTNNGSGVITCNRAGIYLVTTSVVLESPLATALTRTDIGIRKNGNTIVAATTNDSTLALGNNVRSMTTSTIINLAANDTIAAVVNLFGADATGRAIRLPALFGTTATQVSSISIQKLEL